MIAIQTSARNGNVVAATLAEDADGVMLITTGGVLIRTRVREIRQMSRATQGVTLINLGADEKLAGLQKIIDTDDEVAGESSDADLAITGVEDAGPANDDQPVADSSVALEEAVPNEDPDEPQAGGEDSDQ